MSQPLKPLSPVDSNLLRDATVPVHATDQLPELVIDEADALFSKRTEVCDGHDRYGDANADLPPHKP